MQECRFIILCSAMADLTQVIEAHVQVLLLDPGISGVSSLLNIYLPTSASGAVYVQCFYGQVILDGPKETRSRPPLMQFMVVPTKGKKPVVVGSCLHCRLRLLLLFCMKGSWRNSSSL
jgi:hypothetical protein